MGSVVEEVWVPSRSDPPIAFQKQCAEIRSRLDDLNRGLYGGDEADFKCRISACTSGEQPRTLTRQGDER